jgi:uncharacterized protein YggU (UPF0235/DUF167 family)
MKFLEKIKDFTYILNVKVKPNSRKQNIINNGEFLTIWVRSKAVQNKANKELINLIKRKLKIASNQIQIITGLKSSYKQIQLDFLDEVREQEIYSKFILEKI